MKSIAQITVLFAILFYACNDKVAQPEINDNSQKNGEIVLKLSLSQAPDSISQIEGFLTHSQYDTIPVHFQMSEDSASAYVTNIPVGNWNLRVDAYNQTGVIIYTGTQNVSIFPGALTPIQLQLHPATGELEIEVTWNTSLIYYEGFEQPIQFGEYDVVNGNSLIKTGRDGWRAYAQASYDGHEVSNAWVWRYVFNSENSSIAIRGETTRTELGKLWLYKSIPVDAGQGVLAIVHARTQKTHNGTDTGPRIYIFDGTVAYPAEDHASILDEDRFSWPDREWSPWKEMSVSATPTQNSITIALCVSDAWNSYSIYHEFDSIEIYAVQ